MVAGVFLGSVENIAWKENIDFHGILGIKHFTCGGLLNMRYRQGNTGRIFVARADHGDDLIKEMKNLAEEEKIEAAVLYVIGALKHASLVVGPEECSIPPVPVWRKFDDCREVIGVGTMFRDESGQPAIHLHGAVGRGGDALMGCIRGEAGVYLVAELIVLEMVGTGAVREYDGASGLKMLTFLP